MSKAITNVCDLSRFSVNLRDATDAYNHELELSIFTCGLYAKIQLADAEDNNDYIKRAGYNGRVRLELREMDYPSYFPSNWIPKGFGIQSENGLVVLVSYFKTENDIRDIIHNINEESAIIRDDILNPNSNYASIYKEVMARIDTKNKMSSEHAVEDPMSMSDKYERLPYPIKVLLTGTAVAVVWTAFIGLSNLVDKNRQ